MTEQQNILDRVTRWQAEGQNSMKPKQEKINDFYMELLREFDFLLNYELAFKIAHMAGKHFGEKPDA